MIDYQEFNQLMHKAKEAADVDLMAKLLEFRKNGGVHPAPTPYQYQPEAAPKLSLEMDDWSKRKNVTINVQIMVENLLGGKDPNRDVQVVLEKYGMQQHSDMVQDNLSFVVVNLCDLKTGHIITLRETYAKFPSPEFLTKLELLRVGKADVVV